MARYEVKRFVCMKCGSLRDVPKKECKGFRYGHIKHMWCPKCKDEVPFIQEVSYVDKENLNPYFKTTALLEEFQQKYLVFRRPSLGPAT